MQILRPITVKFPKRLVAQFKKQAKAAFPHETWAALLGTERVNGSRSMEVCSLFVPESVSKHCKTATIDMQHGWFTEAQEYAQENDIVLLGDIHSHPYTYDILKASHYKLLDRTLSEPDLDYTRWDGLSAIMVVEEYRPFKLRARYRIWGPITPVLVVESSG